MRAVLCFIRDLIRALTDPTLPKLALRGYRAGPRGALRSWVPFGHA